MCLAPRTAPLIPPIYIEAKSGAHTCKYPAIFPMSRTEKLCCLKRAFSHANSMNKPRKEHAYGKLL